MIDALLRRELVEAAIEALPLIVVDLDTGTILHATRPAEDLLGYGVRGDLVGQHASILAADGRSRGMARDYAGRPVPVPLGSAGKVAVKGSGGAVVQVVLSLTPVKLSDRRCVVAVALPAGGA